MKLSQWFGLAVLLMSAYILWQLRQAVLLVFLAILLTTALNRGVKFLGERLGLGRSRATLWVLGLSGGLISLFFALIVPPFLDQFQMLVELWPQIWQKLDGFLDFLQAQETALGLNLVLSQQSPLQTLSNLAPTLFQRSLTLFSNSAIVTVQMIFVIALTVMMLGNPQAYRHHLLTLLPGFYRRRADEILTLSEMALGNWLTGIALSSVFIGLMCGLGVWILGIKLVLVHGLMAGILNFIPNIGPAASVVFPVMIALLGEPWKIGAVLVLYFIIQNIESYWLTPMIMAKQVSLLPALTLMAQIIFTTFFGLWGLILALPLTVVAKTWVEEALFKDILDQWS